MANWPEWVFLQALMKAGPTFVATGFDNHSAG